LFASRTSTNDASAITNTENEIINILLDELENFDGILFATTNLPENQDDAFSRRFLFKMNFKKPDQLIRSKIFQLKLDSLPNNYCNQLAANYQLSGGEIDNIARKIEINSILNGTVPTFEMVSAYCEEEKRIKPFKFVEIKGFTAN
jgi:SpoVK/Ycf46/Vps4 family AAA+-type ATPase